MQYNIHLVTLIDSALNSETMRVHEQETCLKHYQDSDDFTVEILKTETTDLDLSAWLKAEFDSNCGHARNEV